ncbi:hypothetical protein, partial [Anaerotruncus massiliensis (ex Liu et al. 2021)]|uniref:hypothetical protein n=1 Tax=Anaerotruncus massiliensis (ex Liu et al. 2021) TaxID=2321404 RepID=UPI003A89CD7B
RAWCAAAPSRCCSTPSSDRFPSPGHNNSRSRAALGAKCREAWPEVCSSCPPDGLGEDASSHPVCCDPLLKGNVDVTA